MTLREQIRKAADARTGIGHFNVATIDGIWAVADAAMKLGVPVIIGLSEGERDYVGVSQAVAIIKSIREERNQPIYLNADHTYSFTRVQEAIDAGFDAVIFDGAKLSFEENVRITKQCVEYARKHKKEISTKEDDGTRSVRDVIIEGELGFIGTSSKVLDEIPLGAVVSEDQMTKPSDALRFVRETGVDLLAPAVGNIHGVIRGGDPDLNVKRVAEISNETMAVGVPLVLHGASGNSPADIQDCVKAGTVIVHVNTELRMAYRAALVKSLSEDREEVAPYKYLKPAKLAMQKVVEEKIRLIAGK